MKQMSRDFRLLAAGQGLSWLGNGFQTVALAVAILLAGGGAGDLGLVMAASVVAMLCGTLFGGVWADRMQPQRVMVLSDVVRAVAATGIALVFGTGHYALPLVMAFAAISAGAGAFFGPAFTSLKPMLVPADRRQSANATLSLLQTTCAVIGPALGGLVVARFGATTGFAVNAFSFAVSTVTALLIRARVTRPPRQGMLRELGAGWLEIRRRDWLLVGVLAATVYHIANGVVLVLIQVLAIERLGGASAAGLVAAAEGLGGVVGAAVGMRFKPRRLLRAGWLTLMLMPVWVLVYVWPGVLTAVAAGAVVGYAGLAFFSVAWETALQDHIPHDRLARVASWDMLTSFLAMPLGNALAGPLASAFGYDPVLVVCAIVLLGASVTPLAVAGSRRLTRSTVETAAAPEPATASV
ncbi:putative MFS family arabinose efflux permease [Hamadaea flava]|uniref:MFS transporter n=1 Tax=Hamadaea flava TaxID=1742688 RepID=A0ABV8LNI7_9ACTN|nr:MFS transporter [Hamadaea flava]MCP2321539.1 putative MFS family arabinose efflux permease [Hamadaea flava]